MNIKVFFFFCQFVQTSIEGKIQKGAYNFQNFPVYTPQPFLINSDTLCILYNIKFKMIEEASFQGEHKKIQFLFDILIFIYVLLIRKLERFRLVDDIVESYLDDEGYDSLNIYSSIYTFKVLYFFPLSIIGNKEYLFLYNIYRFSVLLFSLICVHISKQQKRLKNKNRLIINKNQQMYRLIQIITSHLFEHILSYFVQKQEIFCFISLNTIFQIQKKNQKFFFLMRKIFIILFRISNSFVHVSPLNFHKNNQDHLQFMNMNTSLHLIPEKLEQKTLQHSDSIKEILQLLHKSIFQLSQNVQKSQSTSQTLQQKQILDKSEALRQKGAFKIQQRFQSVILQRPTLKNIKSAEGKMQLKIWLGKLLSRVLSQGFKLFSQGKLNEKRTRIFCSENILYNIIELIRNNKLEEEEIELINTCLQEDLVPYEIKKYPKTQDSQINLALMEKISQTDNMSSNRNDMVYWSKINFQYKEYGDYSEEIMQFLNYIIQLPNEIIEESDDEKLSVADCFAREMEEIFRKIQNREEFLKMKKFDKKKPQNIKKLYPEDYLQESLNEKKQEDLEMNSDQQVYLKKQQTSEESDYAGKVSEYSRYKIGRKISKNFKVFSNKNIKSGYIQIEDVRILRILTKWCQELQKNFTNIIDRDELFRMINGSESFLSEQALQKLKMFLDLEKKKITEYKIEIMKNNFKHQKNVSNEQFYGQFQHYSDLDSKVGFFSTLMLNNNKNYLIDYLNKLINGLLSACKKLYFSEIYPIKQQKFEDMNERCSDLLKRQKITDSFKSRIPILISFRVGDLLRCKCSSKQNQIVALFNEFERINYHFPKYLKILRVKNKLHQETRDILINLLYKQKIVVEVQLAIKADRSKFIEHSDKFNHFIYELERADFGPILELCKIWVMNDPRAQFYAEQIKSQSLYAEKQGLREQEDHVCQFTEKIQNPLPLKCQKCKVYLNNIFIDKSRFCNICKRQICFPCFLQKVREQLPKQKQEEYRMVKIKSAKQIPQFGQITKIVSKNSQVIKYRKIQRNGKAMVLIFQGNQKYQLIELKNERSLKQFITNNLITAIDKSELEGDMLSDSNINKNFFIPLIFKNCNNKNKETLFIRKHEIDDSDLQKIGREYKKFPQLKRLNLFDNSLTNFSLVTKLIPNAEEIVLNSNKIQEIKEKDYKKIRKIKNLFLKDNRLKQISNQIGSLKHLMILQISNNEISRLPSTIGQCENLQQLIAMDTKIKVIPEQFTNCSNVEVLKMKSSLLQKLPNNIGHLKKLNYISVSQTQIKQIPKSIGQCESLQYLWAQNCKIQYLPEELSNCLKIQSLRLNASTIKNLPKNIGNLKNLDYFVLPSQIQELPSSIGGCERLDTLFVQNSKIKIIPEQLCQCSNLKMIYFSDVQISNLPSNINRLKRLETIFIAKTKISKLPKGVGGCQNLKQLFIKDSQQMCLPEELEKCCNLELIKLYKVGIKQIPQFLKNMKIKDLNVSFCPLKEEPKILSEMKSLKNLTYSKQTKISEGLKKKLKQRGVTLEENKGE